MAKRQCRTLARLAQSILAGAIVAFTSGLASADDARVPDIDRLVSLPTLSGTPPSRPIWSPDGSHLAFLWNDSGFPFRDIYVVGASSGEPKQLTDLSPEASEQATFGSHLGEDTSLAALEQASARRHAGGIGSMIWSAQGDSLYFNYAGKLQRVSLSDGGLETLIDEPAGRSSLALSPDGSHLSFLQDGDLWLYRFDGGFLMRATRVGVPAIGGVPRGAYNTRDREYSRYRWSADSRYVALEYVDRRDAHIMQIPSYLHDEPVLHKVRRVYPGEEGVVRKVGIYDVSNGVVSFLDLEEPTRRTVMTLEWSPTAPELLVQQDTYDGEHRWLFVADAATRKVREVHHDYRPRRIYALFTAAWDREGSRIIYVGDTDDWYRLYSIPADGGKADILTRGDFDVTGPGFSSAVLQVDANSGDIFYTASEAGPAERQVYRMPVGGGSGRQVTSVPGTHESAALSPDGKHLASIVSADTRPGELHIVNASGGDSRQVTQSPLPAFADFPLANVRYVSFPSRIDDFTLRARIIEPADLDPTKSYPVIIGNVYSATARNQWTWPRPVSLLQHAMAHDGDYITVQVDLRGSSGYGVDFREAFQGDWGGGDLEDLHSTVDYLKTLPYVDADRIGIWGNSYGGMMALFALFERPGMFAAGVAGSPAIDVNYFTQNDQHLSRRPHTHPQIFRDSTLLNYGEKLEDPLMIIHGLHDDIVPWKTTAAMIEKLMLLGKDFDMVVPPQSAHWWGYPEHYAVHTFRKMRAFFDRHVGAGARER